MVTVSNVRSILYVDSLLVRLHSSVGPIAHLANGAAEALLSLEWDGEPLQRTVTVFFYLQCPHLASVLHLHSYVGPIAHLANGAANALLSLEWKALRLRYPSVTLALRLRYACVTLSYDALRLLSLSRGQSLFWPPVSSPVLPLHISVGHIAHLANGAAKALMSLEWKALCLRYPSVTLATLALCLRYARVTLALRLLSLSRGQSLFWPPVSSPGLCSSPSKSFVYPIAHLANGAAEALLSLQWDGEPLQRTVTVLTSSVLAWPLSFTFIVLLAL